jgi:O-antigen/teichoic acid export membrane protein
VGGVARGGLFLFIGLVAGSILGYIYWFLVSFFGGAEIVGIASSVVSLSSLVAGITVFGLPTGVQRFLGRDFTHKRTESLNTYFWSSFIFIVTLCLLSAFALWVIAILNVPLIGFSKTMLISAGFLVFLSFSGILSALLVSIIHTGSIAVSYIVASLAKLGSGVLLLYLGLGWFGAVMGILFSSLSMVVLMLFFALRELRRLGGIRIGFSFKALRESLRAGSVVWLPGVVALLGQQLGILTVFGIQGESEAGTYFIAYTIFGLVSMLPSSFMSILFPILSGLTDGGREAAWRVLKICLALACPPTAFLMLYSGFPLSLVGGNYIEAAPTLALLASSIIPLILISAVNSLVYAFGSYGKVLGMGLAVNVPQVMLYFLLVPLYGGFGAALSFLVGALTGLGAAIFVSRRVQFQVSKRKITVAVAVPLAAGLLSLLLGFGWLVGGIIILVASVFCYGRLGVVQRVDLAEIARGFASEKTIAKAGSKLNWILRIIYG